VAADARHRRTYCRSGRRRRTSCCSPRRGCWWCSTAHRNQVASRQPTPFELQTHDRHVNTLQSVAVTLSVRRAREPERYGTVVAALGDGGRGRASAAHVARRAGAGNVVGGVLVPPRRGGVHVRRLKHRVGGRRGGPRRARAGVDVLGTYDAREGAMSHSARASEVAGARHVPVPLCA